MFVSSLAIVRVSDPCVSMGHIRILYSSGVWTWRVYCVLYMLGFLLWFWIGSLTTFCFHCWQLIPSIHTYWRLQI